MDYIEQGTCLIDKAVKTELHNHTSPAVRAIANIFDFPWRVDVLALGVLLKSIENPSLKENTFYFISELQKLIELGKVSISQIKYYEYCSIFYDILCSQNQDTVIEAMKIILPELQIEQYAA